MRNLMFIFREHKENLYKIFKLSYYDFVAPLRDTYLGYVWILLNPLMQIGVYWFVFGMGIRGGRPVDGHPYLLWMLSGMIPWFYISSCINTGATSIYSKSSILTKMKFPTSIIPTYNTFTQFLNSIPVLILMIIIYAFHGYKATPYYIQLIYYSVAATCITISISFLTSALVVATRDVNRLIGTIMRFLFYLTPILWRPESMPKLAKLLKLNPFMYIVDGYRNCMLYNKWFFEDIPGTIYFWVVTVIFLIIGVNVHMRLRNRFTDLI